MSGTRFTIFEQVFAFDLTAVHKMNVFEITVHCNKVINLHCNINSFKVNGGKKQTINKLSTILKVQYML
jgi:hypothetical protein